MDERIRDCIDNSDMILIGLGENLSNSGDKGLEAVRVLANVLLNKNYYCISLAEGLDLSNTSLDMNKVVQPLISDEHWEDYNRWLTFTLNQRLGILELGVGLKEPTLIRWPFEKITMINNKARMIRVHPSLYQATEEIREKCTSIKSDALSVLVEI